MNFPHGRPKESSLLRDAKARGANGASVFVSA
jgi:hypothetical protein